MDIHKEIKFDYVNLNNATNVRDTNENLLQLEQMEAKNEKEVQEHSWLSDVMQSNLTTVTGSRSQKKYICLICKTDFPTILSAITHIKGHRKPFCYICLSIFQTEIELVSVTKFLCFLSYTYVAKGHEKILKVSHVQVSHNLKPSQVNFIGSQIAFRPCQVVIVPSEQQEFQLEIKQELLDVSHEQQFKTPKPPGSSGQLSRITSQGSAGRKLTHVKSTGSKSGYTPPNISRSGRKIIFKNLE